MAFVLAEHLGMMARTVDNLERDGKPAKAVIASRVFDTDAADLWDALTSPERLKRWFAPVSGELKLGGRFQVENNAGGTITACERDRHIAASWEFGGGISWIEIDLLPEGDGTRLELRHIAHVDPHWDMFGPGAVGVGWDLAFMGLARHVAEPQAARPAEAEEGWFATEEARDMIRTASDGWGAAALGAGEDRDKALASAEATRRFYTGEAMPEA